MLYVVEFPHQGRPHAWFAFNREDFVRKVQVARPGALCPTDDQHAGAESEFDACIIALAQDLKDCRVYGSDAAAVNALYHDPLYDPAKGFYAHMALREQLIAMEVITDDL